MTKKTMSLEELRIEAEKLGYKLRKIEPYEHFKPCVCGHNRRTTIYGRSGIYFECKVCGLESPVGRSEKDAKDKWNKMIEEFAKNASSI